MEKILTLFFSLIFLTGFGQVNLVTSQMDFGLLTRADENFADFGIQNNSEKPVIIFRVEVPKNVDVTFSAKTIEPGKTEYVRLRYNPNKEGAFKEEFDVFTSAWVVPQQITLKGESTYAADRFVPCPDFSDNPVGSLRPFSVTARTMRNIPLVETQVQVFKDGEPVGKYFTDINGELDLNLPLGRYYFALSGLDTSIFVNATNDHLVAFLDIDQKEEVRPTPIAPRTVATSDTPETPATPEVVSSQPGLDNIPVEEDLVLPLSKFKPNNLVFLVDVSTSMKHNGKLDLLKVAMINLVDVLRDVDRFTLISYATDAGVIIKTESNLDKEACKLAIKGLTAGGKTEGTKAINRAGQAAMDFFIDGGNNQIILATDGAFNEGADKAQKLSAKYKRKGVVTSVLGIKCGKYTTKEMKELADKAGGNFVALDGIEDADEKLLDEVKLRSAK
ncbi:VWA domain-containing protein [Cryomorphaceae bacterium 1068]|nr:VWA domain-containing protein [Cryomorphaceae bacterium 1068]